MSHDTLDPRRRLWLRQASQLLVAIPVMMIGRPACAAVNGEARTRLAYQDHPKDNMTCQSCLEFIPGASDDAPGRCKVIPGDDEISPQGYCTAWNTL
ncbi:MAG: high-potential iron-sulfur protein [Proteobacteria bacterium]|nr:high-potential iron-sulfur protein [Pseudomonadota bacterium]HQR02946.1 high-potential iron-sulfur protein [Rhodocyclaceae bacterium]